MEPVRLQAVEQGVQSRFTVSPDNVLHGEGAFLVGQLSPVFGELIHALDGAQGDQVSRNNGDYQGRPVPESPFPRHVHRESLVQPTGDIRAAKRAVKHHVGEFVHHELFGSVIRTGNTGGLEYHEPSVRYGVTRAPIGYGAGCVGQEGFLRGGDMDVDGIGGGQAQRGAQMRRRLAHDAQHVFHEGGVGGLESNPDALVDSHGLFRACYEARQQHHAAGQSKKPGSKTAGLALWRLIDAHINLIRV